ncbi:MAG TPA: class I SAM-dependent methyltransferase [Pyrinomonadaceae bacterium]|jgi:SAM-dependent methyltransferase
MNFFAFKSAAERYQRGRPFFHPFVINRFKELFGFSERAAHALDVGCGTGLSTIALAEIARRMVGVDASPMMLVRAVADARISYAVAVAEQLPFSENEFDLMTLSQVCHWLDRARFFAEAHRVLSPGAWLIVYDAYFSVEAAENSEFQAWHRTLYLPRYPSPARSWFTLTADEAAAVGFQLRRAERLSQIINFTLEGLVDYLLSQSNIIAAVEDGTEEIDEVRGWLTASLGPLFRGQREVGFTFINPVWYLRSNKESE